MMGCANLQVGLSLSGGSLVLLLGVISFTSKYLISVVDLDRHILLSHSFHVLPELL